MKTSQELRALVLSGTDHLLKQQVVWRRHFHQYPELSDQEFETTTFIDQQVRKLGLKKLPITSPTGLLAELKGKYPGPCLAIRTDIDALPVLEQTNLPYRSRYEGKMHACGHDVHMAVVLGVASVLAELKDRLHGRVRFIFQPAEEMPPGGARPMIADGALKDVSMILGLHVDPSLPVGKIGLRNGPIMASVCDFNLTVQGRGGHAAHPELAIDAITAAAEIVTSIQKIVSREIAALDPVVITFGRIEGGQARNVICDKVSLVGTARALAADTSKKLPKLIKRTADGIARAHGAKVEMKLVADYPVLSNDPAVNDHLSCNYEYLFGRGHIVESPQSLGGEDFACYLERVKGAMFRLGIKNRKIGADKPWHSPQFVVDEKALYYGTSLLAMAALDFLKGQK